jgi:hypothetical protein
MRAARFVIAALAPVSWNLTGTVLPSLNTDVPSALMGCRTFDHETGTATTVTLNEPVAGFPCASCAEQFTVVVVMGKTLPEAGEHETATDPSTRSAAVAVQEANAPDGPVASSVMSAGNSRVGGVVSSIAGVVGCEAAHQGGPNGDDAVRTRTRDVD